MKRLAIEVDRIDLAPEKPLIRKRFEMSDDEPIDQVIDISIDEERLGLMVTCDPLTGGIVCHFGSGPVVHRETASYETTIINLSCNISDETPMDLCFRYKSFELQIFVSTEGVFF